MRLILLLISCILLAPLIFTGWVLLPGSLAHPHLEEVWVSDWYDHYDRFRITVTTDGLVLVRSGTGLECLDQEGTSLWQMDDSDLPADYRWIYQPEAGLLLFDNAHTVRLLDVGSGEVKWEAELPDGLAASGKIGRCAISPNGNHIAVANAGSVAVRGADGELLSSTDTSSLGGQIFRLHMEDSGQLTICLRQGQGPGMVYSHERLINGTFQPVFTNLPGNFAYAQLTENGLFYFSTSDWNKDTHSVMLLNPDGTSVQSIKANGSTIKMIDNEAYIAWITGGTLIPGSSVGRLRLDDGSYEEINTGSTSPGLPVSIDRDGSLLVLASPGMNTRSYAWLHTGLMRTHFRLYTVDPGLADLLPVPPMSRHDCVMLIDSAGQQRIFQTPRDMRILDSFQNDMLDGEFGILYALEYEAGADGKPDYQHGRTRVVKQRVPGLE